MNLQRHLVAFAVTVTLMFGSDGHCQVNDGSNRTLAAPPTAAWHRGQGELFEVLIQGNVTLDGQRLTDDVDVELKMTRNDQLFWSHTVRSRNGRYEAWAPVGAHPIWHAISVSAHHPSGAAGRDYTTVGILQRTLYDGLDLKLSSPTRTLKVKVMHQGQPVRGAKILFDAKQGDQTLETDGDGLAYPQICGETPFFALMAWTDDHLLSGKTYFRPGTPQFDNNELELELVRCKSVKFVVKDEHGLATAGVPIGIFPSRRMSDNDDLYFSAPPSVQYVSDAAGMFEDQWLPDLPDIKISFGPQSRLWIQQNLDVSTSPITLNVRQAKQRVKLEGHIEAPPGVNVAGLYVALSSHQAEQEGIIEDVKGIVDSAGNFSVSVLPGSTYAAYVHDSRIVSEFQKVYVDPALSIQPHLKLTAVQGVPIVVQVTQGESSQPQPGARVSVRSDFHLNWVEDGRRTGAGVCRTSDGFTNELGQFTLYGLPGKVKVSASYGQWNAETKQDLKPGDNSPVIFNRKLQGILRGHVTIDDPKLVTNAASLAGTKVMLAAIDNRIAESQTVLTDAEGKFEVKTSASALRALAISSDENMIGVADASDVNEELSVRLKSTNSISGRLTDTTGKPLVGHEIEAQVPINNRASQNPVSFIALRRYATTDQAGRFKLENLPCGIHINLITYQVERGQKELEYLATLLLNDPSDKRPDMELQVGRVKSETTLADRLNSFLFDCRLNDYRLLVIIGNKSDAIESVLSRRLLDSDEVPALRAYMILRLTNAELADQSLAAIRDKYHWPEASDQQLFTAIIDGGGNELDRSSIDARDSAAVPSVIDMISKHTPAMHDAQLKWKAAFEEATRTNRRVWARVGSRSCGPCLRLTRWIESQRVLLEKEFVLLKFDVGNDANVEPISDKIFQNKFSGIPFHAIYGPDGERLIDSEGPLGNIGSIGFQIESLRHFRQMLETGCRHLSASEIDRLLKSLAE